MQGITKRLKFTQNWLDTMMERVISIKRKGGKGRKMVKVLMLGIYLIFWLEIPG